MGFLSKERPDNIGQCFHCGLQLYRVGSRVLAAGLRDCLPECCHAAERRKNLAERQKYDDFMKEGFF